VFSPGDLVRVKMGDRGKPMSVPMFPLGSDVRAPAVQIPSGSVCLVLEVRENTFDRRCPGLVILGVGHLLETSAIYMEARSDEAR